MVFLLSPFATRAFTQFNFIATSEAWGRVRIWHVAFVFNLTCVWISLGERTLNSFLLEFSETWYSYWSLFLKNFCFLYYNHTNLTLCVWLFVAWTPTSISLYFGFWLFTLQIARLSGYVNSIVQFFKSYIYILLIVNPVLHHAIFFYAFSELCFHTTVPVFNLVCLHFAFISQSNVSFCKIVWEKEGGVCVWSDSLLCSDFLSFSFNRTFIDNRIHFLTNVSFINMINNNNNNNNNNWKHF